MNPDIHSCGCLYDEYFEFYGEYQGELYVEDRNEEH